MANTMIPMPPIQCVRLLQNKIPLGSDSISFNIVDPVVVYPEIVSNSAFVNSGIAPVNRNGSVPDKVITIQPKATTK